MLKRIIALTVIICLGIEQSGYAQVAHMLDIGAASGLSAMERFRPMQLRSLIYDSRARKLDLVVDKGDKRKARQEEVGEAAARLMEYFRIGVALPDSSFWVNLRPDGADRVIDPVLEKTDLGKVLLAADLALKKDMAKATSPNTALGRKYWNRLYAKAETLFGSREVTIPTLARPWIVPGEIIVRQSNSSAYVYKAALQVQLEQDRLQNFKTYRFDDPRTQQLNEYSTALIRELILPELAKRVNSSRTYAELRQVYYSLILAQWFKRHFNGGDTEYSRLIDSSDISGLNSKTPWSKDTYFEAYRKSFNEGEYNTRESVNDLTGTTMRNYVSGGIVMTGNMQGWIAPLRKNIIYRNEVALDGGTLRPVVINGAVQLNADPDKQPADSAAVNTADDAVPYTSVYDQGPKWSFFRGLEVSGYASIVLGSFAWFSSNVIGIPLPNIFVGTLILTGIVECISGMMFGGLEPVEEPAQKDGGSYKTGILIESLKNALKSGDGVRISDIIHELGRTTSLAALGYLVRLKIVTHLQNSALVRRAATLAMDAIEARWVPVLNKYIKDYAQVRVTYIDPSTGAERSKVAVIMRLVRLDGEDIRLQFYGTASMLFLSEITDITPVASAKDGGMPAAAHLSKSEFAQINTWIDEAQEKFRRTERKALWEDAGAVLMGVAAYGLLIEGLGGQPWLLLGIPFVGVAAILLKSFGYDHKRHYPIVPGLSVWIQNQLNDHEQLPATWYKMWVHLIKKTREMPDGQVVYGGGEAREISPEKVQHIEAMIIEYFRILTDRFEKPGSDKTSQMMHRYRESGQSRFFGDADPDQTLWTDGGMSRDTVEQVVTVAGGVGVVAATWAVYSAFGSMAAIGALFAGVIALALGGTLVVDHFTRADRIQRDGGSYEGGFHFMRWFVGYGIAGVAGVIGGLLLHNPLLVNGGAAVFGAIISFATMSADVHAVKRERIFRENPVPSLDGYVQDSHTPVFDNVVANILLAVLGQAVILAFLGPGGPVLLSGVESGFWFNAGLVAGSILGGVLLYRKASTSITETYDFNHRRDGGMVHSGKPVAHGKVYAALARLDKVYQRDLRRANAKDDISLSMKHSRMMEEIKATVKASIKSWDQYYDFHNYIAARVHSVKQFSIPVVLGLVGLFSLANPWFAAPLLAGAVVSAYMLHARRVQAKRIYESVNLIGPNFDLPKNDGGNVRLTSKVRLTPAEYLWVVKRSVLQMFVGAAWVVPVAFVSAAIFSGAWVIYAGAAFGTWLTLTIGFGGAVSAADLIWEFVKSYRLNRKHAVEFKEMLAKFDGGTVVNGVLADQWLNAIWDWNLREKPQDADITIGKAARALSLTPEFAAQRAKTSDEIQPERIYISATKPGPGGYPLVVRGSDIVGHDSRRDGTEIVDWKGHEEYVAGLDLRDPIQVLQARGELETIWRSDVNFDGGFAERFRFLRSRTADTYILALNKYDTPLTASENIAEKLGLLGEAKAIEPLKRYLVDVVLGDDYDVYPAAEEALRRLGLTDNDFEQLYLSAFRNPTNHRLVRKNAAKVLGERVGGISAYIALTGTIEDDLVVKWAIDQAVEGIAPRLSGEGLRLRALLADDDVGDDRVVRAALIKLTDLGVFFINSGDFVSADAVLDTLGKKFARGITVTMYGPGYMGDGDSIWSFKRIAEAAGNAGQWKYIERMIDILGPNGEMDDTAVSRACDRVVQMMSAAPMQDLDVNANAQADQLSRKIFGLVGAGCDHACLLVSHILDSKLIKMGLPENEKVSVHAWSWLRLTDNNKMRIMATRALGHTVAERLEKGYPVHPAYVLDVLRETVAAVPEADRAYYVQEGVLPAMREMTVGFFTAKNRDDVIFPRKAVAMAAEFREYSFDREKKAYIHTVSYLRANWLLVTIARYLAGHCDGFTCLLNDKRAGKGKDIQGVANEIVKPLEGLSPDEQWNALQNEPGHTGLTDFKTLEELNSIVNADAVLYRTINEQLAGEHWNALCADAACYLNKRKSTQGVVTHDGSTGDVGVQKLAEYLVQFKKTVGDAVAAGHKADVLGAEMDRFLSATPVSSSSDNKPAGQVIDPGIFIRDLKSEISRDGGTVKLKNGAEADAALVEKVMAQVRVLYFERDLVLMELLAKINDPEYVFYGDRGTELMQRGLVEADGTVPTAVRDIVLSGVVGDGLFMRIISPLAGENTGRYDGGSAAGKLAMERLASAVREGNGRLAGLIAQSLGRMGYVPAVGALTALEADNTLSSYGWFARSQAKMALFEIKYRVVQDNIRQFTANPEWQVRYREGAHGVFGVTNEYGMILHLTGSADLADGLVSQGVEGLYKFSIESGTLSLDSALTENRGFTELVLRQTIAAWNIPVQNAKKDGGLIPGDMGGIDMRSLPAVTVPARPLMASAAAVSLSLKDLDRQWSDIRVEMAKGGKPYLKMKSYVVNCSARPDTAKQLHAVHAYVADILKHEEEDAVVTCSELKEIILQLS